jgi:hypothetical protein
MTPEERVNVLLQLQQALRDSEKSFNRTEFGRLYKEAQSVPGLDGDILKGNGEFFSVNGRLQKV